MDGWGPYHVREMDKKYLKIMVWENK